MEAGAFRFARGLSGSALSPPLEVLQGTALVTAGEAPPLEQVGSLVLEKVRLLVEMLRAGPPFEVVSFWVHLASAGGDALVTQQPLRPLDTQQSARFG